MALFVRPRPPAFLKEGLAKNLLSRLGPLADARAVWVMDARSRVSAERKYSTSRPCGTQEGGLSGVQPPALAAGKKAACPARPRAGLSCAVTHPAIKRGVGGTLPPVRGSRGQSPLPGGAGDASPVTSLKNGQLLPAARRVDMYVFPSCPRISAERKYSTSRPCGTQEGGLPGVQPPALAAGKRAACPARPRAGNYENFVNFGMLCLTAARWVLIIRKELVQKETIFLG